MSVQDPSPQHLPPVDTDAEHKLFTEPEQQGSNGKVSDASKSVSSSRVHSRSPPPGIINMSGLRTTLPDISLNSPSTNIIGTPFAHTTSNTPFEYPFPETPDPSSPVPSHPAFRPGSPYSSFSPPHLPISVERHPSVSVERHPSRSGTFSLIQPKFRVEAPVSPPPIPPSLKKKRWSLNILGRKRTSNPPTPTGDGPSSPLGSPPAATCTAVPSGLGSGRPRLGGQKSSGDRQTNGRAEKQWSRRIPLVASGLYNRFCVSSTLTYLHRVHGVLELLWWQKGGPLKLESKFNVVYLNYWGYFLTWSTLFCPASLSLSKFICLFPLSFFAFHFYFLTFPRL